MNGEENKYLLYESTLNIDTQNQQSLQIELTNTCNLKCVFCLNPLPDFRKKGIMNDVVFNKIVREASAKTTIVLCGIGEPTLHPKFEEYLSILSSKFKNIYLVTNGQFDTDICEIILNSSLSKVTFSLDYFDIEEYRKNKNGDFYRVLKNIEYLLKFRKNEDLVFQINMLAEKGKTDQIVNALKYFSKIFGKNDFVYSRNIKSLAGQVKVEGLEDSNQWTGLDAFKEELSKAVNTDRYFVENWCRFLNLDAPLVERRVCRHPFIYSMILYDGRVTFCCIDFNAKMVAGDLKKENLLEMWTGEKYQKFRNDMSDLNFSDKPLCQNCDEWYKQK